MSIRINWDAITFPDYLLIRDSIKIYDSCEGFKDKELWDLFEVLRKISFTEVK